MRSPLKLPHMPERVAKPLGLISSHAPVTPVMPCKPAPAVLACRSSEIFILKLP